MLLVAIAVCILSVVTGLVVAARAAMRARRRLARLDEALTAGTALAVRAQDAARRAAQIRSELERLRSLAGRPS